jgi:hypothetical protein
LILYGERDYSLLLEKKIPREIFNIINSLYEETKIRVNFFDGLSKPFLSARGVLQGAVTLVGYLTVEPDHPRI